MNKAERGKSRICIVGTGMSPADWHILLGASVKDIQDARLKAQKKYLYQCIVADKSLLSISSMISND